MRYITFLFCALCWTNVYSYSPYHLVEDYLNSIKTYQAKFSQLNPDGTISAGEFHLEKPGKMRWEYLKPKKLLILARQHNIVYCDYDLEEVSYIPYKSVIAYFLSKDNLKLGKDVNVEKYVDDGNNFISMQVSNIDPEHKWEDKILILQFSKSPLELKKIEVIDASKNRIEIRFQEVKINQLIDKEKFIFRNPKFFSLLK